MGEKDDASVRELASVVGKVMSLQVAVPAVRMMTAECYGLIWPDGDWDRRVQLTEAVLRELVLVVDWVSHFNNQTLCWHGRGQDHVGCWHRLRLANWWAIQIAGF